MTLTQALGRLRTPLRPAMDRMQRRMDSIVKPLGSLGLLERHMVKIAGITGTAHPDLQSKAVVVFCADNGVVEQGVAQSTREVTRIVAENLAGGDTCVCAMARVAGARVVPVDVGVAADTAGIPGLAQRKVRCGTGDFSREPAMTRKEARQIVGVGVNLAGELHAQGVNMLATGEMGIGNTTTAAAVAAVLLDLPPQRVCGRGSGLTDRMLARKIQVIGGGVALHRPDPADPLDVLAKVGGLDIAGMAGLCIGGAVYGVPVVLDGVISCVAALVACRLAPGVVDFLLPSHLSEEPAAALVLEELGLRPILNAGLRLGEGTGAVATFPLYDMMSAICETMVTFADEDMEPYRPLGGPAS